MNSGNSVAAFFITAKGRMLAGNIRALYPRLIAKKYSAAAVRDAWKKHRTLIFIMASGIVVRTIAPLLEDKRTDPAVVVVDDSGKHVIGLLSGHLGGANERAREIAGFLGGEAVITTASDVNGLTAIDLWAESNGLIIENPDLLPRIGARLVNRKGLKAQAGPEIQLPPDFQRVNDLVEADIIISNREAAAGRSALLMRPRNMIVGMGCNRRTSVEEIETAVMKTLHGAEISFLSVRAVATIDFKAGEPGIIEFCKRHSLDILSFEPDELNSVPGVEHSDAAFRATGAKAVAEPAALLASGMGGLIVPKQKFRNVTIAISEINKGINSVKNGVSKSGGKISVVGTGPGDLSHITPSALRAIRESDVIVGYGTYIDLIEDLISEKEVYSTGMTHEIDRCRKAVELSGNGRNVAVISGGDPGIYAMAGLVFEVLRQQDGKMLMPEVEVIPGISALNAAAARLGAPLMHDFASVSLSDRLTPWETIEKRLDAATMADFVIVLYNPKSKGRTEQIGRAREIIMKHRSPETPVGIVRSAMREKESVVLTNLEHMLGHEIDMQTSIVIGNSNTFVWKNLMITPRGYEKKKQFHP